MLMTLHALMVLIPLVFYHERCTKNFNTLISVQVTPLLLSLCDGDRLVAFALPMYLPYVLISAFTGAYSILEENQFYLIFFAVIFIFFF